LKDVIGELLQDEKYPRAIAFGNPYARNTGQSGIRRRIDVVG